MRLILFLTFVTGMVATTLLAKWVQESNEQRSRTALVAATERAADAVTKRIELYQYGLRGVRGVLLTDDEWGISRDKFHSYSLVRDIEQEFPGARGFGFIRRVSLDEQTEYLYRVRSDGMVDFDIHQLTPHEGERFIIQYIEPVELNRAALGLDIASEDNRRNAALAAMATGEVRITGPITLVQATGKPLQSFLILLPIYRDSITPGSVEERMAKGYGWAFAPLLTEEVLQSLQVDRDGLHLILSDITDPGNETPFFGSKGAHSGQPTNLSYAVSREVYGRDWKIELRAEPEFLVQMNQNSPLFVALVGFIATTVLTVLAGALVVLQQRRKQILAEQARSAAIVNSSSDGIVGQTLDGKIVSWNHGAELVLGYSTAEAIGHTLLDIVVPEEHWDVIKSMLYRVANGVQIDNFDTHMCHKNGQLVDVSVSVSSIRNDSGAITGISNTIRDISATKASEARILELNARLEDQVIERTKELGETNVLLNNVLQSASEVSIIATDTDGVIQVFNSGAELLLGYSASEMVGLQTPAILHVPEEVDRRSIELSNEYGESIKGFRVFVHKPELEGAESREWAYVRKDGTHITVTLMVTAMRDVDGHLVGYLGIALDLTEEIRLRWETMVALDQLALAAEVAELGVWSWTPKDNQLQWNKRMYELYELPTSLHELTYDHWRSRLHPEDQARAEAELQDALAGKTAFDTVFRVVQKDGNVLYIQPGADVERDTDGSPVKVTGINRDITAQLQLESQLRHAKSQADAANAAKSSFLANMSHEIRTPMNAVLGMLQLVQLTGLSAHQLDYVLKAQGAAKSLLGLLNDVLDYSKIEANKLLLDSHTFELESLLSDLAVVLSGNQGDKNVEVIFDIDTRLPCMIDGDSLRLQQVLINLAGNALKFTHVGQVIVGLHQLQRTADRVRIRVDVSDTGIGISEKHLEHIFDSFTQAEATTTRRYGGTGLGLVICKRLIELMGGVLNVESHPNKGSLFWFELEFGVANDKNLQEAFRNRVEGQRLLIVDSNPDARKVIQRTAIALGWSADVVANDRDALFKLQSVGTFYDVVLMDWHLPKEEGFADLQLIHACNVKRTPLLIMGTANEREIVTNRYGKESELIAGYIHKPITPQQLVVGLDKVHRGGADINPALSGSTLRRLEGLSILVVEDNHLNRLIARELLVSEGAQVHLAEGGEDGVKIVVNTLFPIDAVLMDIQMPNMDGLEATRLIRQHLAQEELPIIAMTANVSPVDRSNCLAAGMNDHVGKPVDIEKLVGIVLQWCGKTSTTNSLIDEATSTQDAKAILKRFGGNLTLFRSMLKSFQADMNEQLKQVELSFYKNDVYAVLARLHTIKGNAGTMGAQTLSLLSGELEQRFKQVQDFSQVDGAWIGTLQHCLNASVNALENMFQQGEKNPAVGEYVRDETLEKNCEILMEQLELGNLAALNTIEVLSIQLPEQLVEPFEPLRQAVLSLDFKRSQQLLQTLLTIVKET